MQENSKKSFDSSFAFQDKNKSKITDKTKKSVGINCNLSFQCHADNSLLPSSKSTLNPEKTAFSLSSSNDACLILPPRNTLNIDNKEMSNQNKITTSIKQRHLSSTPLVPIDTYSEWNESMTGNKIIKRKTPLQYKVTVQNQPEGVKRIVQIKLGRQQMRNQKFSKIEKQLELVKSSWDSEVRFIRYNMEILRNEIELNSNFLGKQEIL